MTVVPNEKNELFFNEAGDQMESVYGLLEIECMD